MELLLLSLSDSITVDELTLYILPLVVLDLSLIPPTLPASCFRIGFDDCLKSLNANFTAVFIRVQLVRTWIQDIPLASRLRTLLPESKTETKIEAPSSSDRRTRVLFRSSYLCLGQRSYGTLSQQAKQLRDQAHERKRRVVVFSNFPPAVRC